tara:strand:+ start:141 stop:428 length:288 start_codon:yes stop_codon:yes gene_type:complete
MQETLDLYTFIIILTFLGILLFIAFIINKKKDFIKSHLNKNKPIDVVNSVILAGGNRATIFEIENKKYLFVSNKSSISNIFALSNNSTVNNKTGK